MAIATTTLTTLTVSVSLKRLGAVDPQLTNKVMGKATRAAALARKPLLKPFIVTRSSFLGSGKYVQKWLGDNLSSWDH